MGDAAFLEVKERGSLITIPTTVFLEVKREDAVFLEVKREDVVFLEVKRERIADFLEGKKRGSLIFGDALFWK